MKLYRGIDYFIYFEDLKHMGVAGAIVPNSDATANIFINTLYDRARMEKAIRHELRHFAKNHLYNDIMTLTEKELDAENINDTDCLFGSSFEWVEYRPKMIPLFNSLDALSKFAQKHIL